MTAQENCQLLTKAEVVEALEEAERVLQWRDPKGRALRKVREVLEKLNSI